jgi:hypothetical protein
MISVISKKYSMVHVNVNINVTRCMCMLFHVSVINTDTCGKVILVIMNEKKDVCILQGVQ